MHSSSTLTVEAKFSLLTPLIMRMRPTIYVDEQLFLSSHWGTNLIPLDPGRHSVFVEVPNAYLIPPTIGRAKFEVELRPGETVALLYAAPVWRFCRGSLGHGPQKHRGGAFPILAICMLIAAVAGLRMW